MSGKSVAISQRANVTKAQRLPKDLDENVLKHVIGKIQYVAVEIVALIEAFFSTLKSWYYGPQFTKKGFDATVDFRRKKKDSAAKSTLVNSYIENAVLQIKKNAFEAIEDNPDVAFKPKKLTKDSIAYKICESIVSQGNLYKITAFINRVKNPCARYCILQTAKDLNISKDIKVFLEGEFQQAEKKLQIFLKNRQTARERSKKYANENALETNEVTVEVIPEEEPLSQSIGLDDGVETNEVTVEVIPEEEPESLFEDELEEGVILDYAANYTRKGSSVASQANTANTLVEDTSKGSVLSTGNLDAQQTRVEDLKTTSNSNIEKGNNQPLNSRNVSWQNTAYTVAVGLVAAYTLYSWYQSYTTGVDSGSAPVIAGSNQSMGIDDCNRGNTSPAFEFPLPVEDITSFVAQNVTSIVNATQDTVATIANNTCEAPVQLATAISTYVRDISPQCFQNTLCHISEAPMQISQNVLSVAQDAATTMASSVSEVPSYLRDIFLPQCFKDTEVPTVVAETVREIAQSSSDPIIDAGDAIIRWGLQKITLFSNLCIEAMTTK